MSSHDLSYYGPALAEVLGGAPEMDLQFGPAHAAMRPNLESLTVERAFAGRPVADRDMAACCVAAAWLVHDFYERSHTISQDIETPAGSYWHGILHRREPDASNAKYWFRRVGEHAIFPDLSRAAADEARSVDVPGAAWLSTQERWDAFKFIDLCETARVQSDETLASLCRRIQMREFWLLLDYCYRRAIGQ
jgi:hypothetical protein